MRLKWGDIGTYRQGVDRGVLYLPDAVIPWDGLTSVTEVDMGELDTTHYYDGFHHRLSQDIGNFAARVEAYSYPKEFEPFDGYDEFRSGQSRDRFSFSWRNQIGNGHEIHVVYGAQAVPTARVNRTLTDAREPTDFAWDISTVSVDVPGARPTAHIVVRTEDCYPEPLAAFQDFLYGTDTRDPQIPTPEAVVELFESFVTLRIKYNGDGTWTATGPDEVVQEMGGGLFLITAPSAFYVDEHTYMISSY